MGIPYYFYTLTKSYGNIISSNIPFQPDIYCMDFNGVIHPICQNLLATTTDIQGFEEELFKALWNKVISDIQVLKPSIVHICVDGVVPLAKMIQQRKRRYLSVFNNKIDNIPIKWDTNAITPGTSFMRKLDLFFKKQVRYNATSTTIYYSGSDEPGEGEHKIFKILQSAPTDANIIINGMDADLIILSLINHRKNIHLMRDTTYLDIDALRTAIIDTLIRKWELTEYSNQDLIESYCVMCSLLGNDFIPHLLTLSLKNKEDSLNKLIQYTGMAYKTFGFLIDASTQTINALALSDILQNIAKTEDQDIFQETKRYIKHTAHNSNTASDHYAIKNKDNIATQIYTNSKWRPIYYKHLFDTNILIDSSVINSACANYIKGIYWTYAYYKRKDIDSHWYYPYTYPPSVKDIANYILGNTEQTIASVPNSLDANIQLLIVLPIESKHLLPPEHQVYMEDVSKGLLHLYPKKYRIHTYLKTHLWECAPVLPIINIDYIKKSLI